MPITEIGNFPECISQIASRFRRNANQATIGSREIVTLTLGFPTRQIRVHSIEVLPLLCELLATVHSGKQTPGTVLFVQWPVIDSDRFLHSKSLRLPPALCQPKSCVPSSKRPRIVLLEGRKKTLDSSSEPAINEAIEPIAVRPLVTVSVDIASRRCNLTARLYIIATSRAYQPIVPDFRDASASFLVLAIPLLASEVEDDH